jgi:flavodoxin
MSRRRSECAAGGTVKTLVVYYSNSGTTMSVAKNMAEKLEADLDAIEETKPRPPLLDEGNKSHAGGRTIARAVFAAILGLGSAIEPAGKDPAGYDLVVVGTPVWGGALTPAVRSYLKHHRKSLRRVAFFCTAGDPQKQRVFKQMRGLAGREPVATLGVKADDVRADACSSVVAAFVTGLKAAGQ